ncbi:MAG: hypothetical protein ABIM30_09920 [candidate division WOR-3 bacterium]
MKNFITLFMICMVILACKKEGYNPDYSNGRFYGLKNGKSWEAEAFASSAMDNRISIIVSRKNSQGFEREGLSIGLIPLKMDEYRLHDHTRVIFGDSLIRAFYATTQDDGDVLEDAYRIIESEPTQAVRITKISNDKKWLEGELVCSFILIPPKINILNPDTVRFENCRFKIKRVN